MIINCANRIRHNRIVHILLRIILFCILLDDCLVWAQRPNPKPNGDGAVSNPCDLISNRCENGGTCQVRRDGSTTCLCPSLFVGPRCELESALYEEKRRADAALLPTQDSTPQLCSDTLCANGGTCYAVDDQIGYRCACAPGWSGPECRDQLALPGFLVSLCIPACPIDSVCLRNGSQSFCVCKIGTFGRPGECRGPVTTLLLPTPPVVLSSQPITEQQSLCHVTSCANGGQCLPTDDGGVSCHCLPGFSGPRCELRLPPGIKPVAQTSLANETQGGRCPEGAQCPDGFVCEAAGDVYACAKAQEFQIGPDASNGNNSELGDLAISNGIANACAGVVCQNEGSCLPFGSNFSCACQPQFSGQYCELSLSDVSVCTVDLCLNGGACVIDASNSPSCQCPQEWSGPRCELKGAPTDTQDSNSADCNGSPCVNGGLCILTAHGIPSCQCPIDWAGEHCELPLLIGICTPGACSDDYICSAITDNSYICEPTGIDFAVPWATTAGVCLSQPCNNDGTCREFQNEALQEKGEVDFECICHPDFSGRFCEVRLIQENILLHPLPPAVSPEIVIPSVTSDLLTSACVTNPCPANATCVDTLPGAYQCVCPGGQNCSVEPELVNSGFSDFSGPELETGLRSEPAGLLAPVQRNVCDPGACPGRLACVPAFDGTGRLYAQCGCPLGSSGPPDCSQNTTAAFAGDSIMVHVINPPADRILLKISFRTTLPDGLLGAGFDLFGRLVFTLGLRNGTLKLELSLNERLSELTIGANLNDGTWWTAGLIYDQKMGTFDLVLLDSSALEVAQNDSHVSPVGGRALMRIANLKFGGLLGPKESRSERDLPNFRGCMRDIEINGQSLVPHESAQNSYNVQPGCARIAQCSPDACSGNGQCVDLWTDYECRCQRPFLQRDCAQSLPPVTFGYEGNHSYASVQVLPAERDLLTQNLDLSFLMLTSATEGQLFFVGPLPSGGGFLTTGFPLSDMFISGEIWNGSLRTVVKLGPALRSFEAEGGPSLADNQWHEVSIIRRQNAVRGLVDGHVVFDEVLPSPVSYPLAVDVVYIGGIPLESDIERARRELQERGPFLSNKSFKGAMQDWRIGGLESHVIFFPDENVPLRSSLTSFGQVTLHNNVLQGMVSDNTCKNNPCTNGGTCEVTFNDYKCVCVRGWQGRNCTEADFCSIVTCPAESTCMNTRIGYVCLTPFSFDDRSVAVFQADLSHTDPHFNTLSLSFRTRDSHAQLLRLATENDAQFLNLELANGTILIGYQLGPDNQSAPPILGTIAAPPSGSFIDAEWHRLDLNWGDFGCLATVDGALAPIISQAPVARSLSSVFGSGSQLFIGHDPQKLEASGFKGCLENVTFGPDLFSAFMVEFFPPEMLVKGQAMFGFKAVNIENVVPGCNGDPQCATESKCQNGATCADIFNAYTCTCPLGFTGVDCEINIDDCVDNECAEFGTCVDGIANYTCACVPGYTGQWCESDFDECASDPCQNGGTCANLFNQFQCSCPENYTGVFCEFKLNVDCTADPCLNGATCSDKILSPLEKTFECSCVGGYKGRRCEQEIDYCETQPCQHQSTCTSHTIRQEYSCQCSFGYTGVDCEINIDDCAGGPCGHGQCLDGIGNFTCLCDPGWEGDVCNADIDECLQSPCLNQAPCSNIPGNYSCDCLPFYLGINCENAGSCLSSPCVRGECNQLTPTEHQCTCPPAYRGPNCDQEINFCESTPCANNATCHSHSSNATFTCHCAVGFLGEICEVNIDECASNPCRNGGQCVDGAGSFVCRCEDTGYSGPLCESDVDECTLGVCQHGLCTNSVGSFDCKCQTGYIGKACSHVDPCVNNRTHECENGGLCHNARVDEGGQILYDCSCSQDFGGERCALHMPASGGAVPLLYIVAPIVGFAILLCLIAAVAFALVARQKRATHGTYSPSRQEVNGARVHLGPVMKPPPEERLI